jgi:hypothetical protein
MLEKIFWTGLHQRVVQLEYAVRIGSYVASKARYTRMTDSAQVVQTTDEKYSGKRVKPYVKPSICNGPVTRFICKRYMSTRLETRTKESTATGEENSLISRLLG